MNFTPELIVAAAGLILAIIFDFVPGAKAWFDTKSVEMKRLINAGILLVVVLGVFGFNCLGWAGGLGIPAIGCDEPGALFAVQLFVTAVFFNYGTHAIARGVTESVSTRA